MISTGFPDVIMISRTQPHPGALLVFAILLAIGLVIVWTGKKAIQSRQYQFEWEQNETVTAAPDKISYSNTHGVDQFQGASAIRIGIGLANLGALFLVWGLGGIWSTLRPANAYLGITTRYIVCFVSLLLQTTALVCLFPPWQVGSGIPPALWITIALLGATLIVINKTMVDVPRQLKLLNNIFIAVAIGTICGAFATHGRWWIGVVLGIFSLISYSVHWMFLSLQSRQTAEAIVGSKSVGRQRFQGNFGS